MNGVSVLAQNWRDDLRALVGAAQEHLTIATPFITGDGVGLLHDVIGDRLQDSGTIEVITDLSPSHVTDGSLELSAVDRIVGYSRRSSLWHIPRLHAKIYVADGKRAIITSGNLTSNALYRNVEYGVQLADRRLIRSIEADLEEFRTLGTTVGREQLLEYATVADKARSAFKKQAREVDRSVKRAFATALRRAQDELVRFKLAGGAMHTVFARTVLHLLQKHGPLQTQELHRLVQQIHPDLCDESVDRVIDGKSFGKKWKHAVRTAQQQLKRRGMATYLDGVWKATEG